MFVSQERDHDRYPGPCGPRESETSGQGREQGNYSEVHDAGDPEGIGDAEALGNGKEASAAVVVDVLASVEDIEAADPEGDCCAKNKHARIEAAGDGDPGGRGRDAEGETENEVGPTGEAFGKGIEEKNEESEGSEFEGQRIQLRGREEKHADGDEREKP